MIDNSAKVSAAAEVRRPNPFVEFVVRLVREKPLGTAGAVIVLGFLIGGIFSEFIAPYPLNEIHIIDRLEPPSSNYLMGTDNLGRDMLSQIIYGARVSLIIGFSVVAMQTVVAVLIGLTSGYIGGTFDLVIQRFVDAWNVLPLFIVYLTVIGMIGSGYLQLILVMGISGGIGGARGPRMLAFWVKGGGYYESAKAVGANTRQIIMRHLLPNVMPMLIVAVTAGIGSVVLMETGLAFLGWGLPGEIPSWGGMISGDKRIYMEGAPWMVVFPGLVLATTIFGLNVFGDAVRDLLDPRMRGGVGGKVGRFGGIQFKAKEKALARSKKKLHQQE